MSETALQRKVRKMIERRGGWAKKIHADAYQGPGIPDLLACVRGHFTAFETKMEGEEPSRIQEHEMSQIAAAGGTALPIWSVEEAEAIIDGIIEGGVE